MIIHRDIKPANIMRSASGVVKLMDFGLAKSIEAHVQKSTVISGTPSYMPPEQLTGKGVDARADLFALGATMYELVTGEVPFHGMIRFESPRSPRELLPSIPPELDQLLMRSMEFDKERRFGSATEMLEPVRALLAELDPAGSRRGALSVPPPRPAGGTVLGIGPKSEPPPAPEGGGAQGG
jgi:serine/threonine-protein kinase